MSQTILWHRMPHNLTIEVSASKAVWLHPGCHWEAGQAQASSQILPQPHLGAHLCLRPTQARNHCAGIDGLAPLHKKAP